MSFCFEINVFHAHVCYLIHFVRLILISIFGLLDLYFFLKSRLMAVGLSAYAVMCIPSFNEVDKFLLLLLNCFN